MINCLNKNVLQLFSHDTSSYDDASMYCYDSHQAFLTGPDSNDEYDKIMEQALNISDQVSDSQSMILIGLKRTTECTTDSGEQDQNSICRRPKGFIWQDGLGETSNTLINQHFNDDPGVETSPDHVRACTGIIIVKGATNNKNVYSLDCSNGEKSSGEKSKMVVCGKLGKCPATTPSTISTTSGASSSTASVSSTILSSTATTMVTSTPTTEKSSTTTTSTPTSEATSTTTAMITTTSGTTENPTTTDCPTKVCRYGFHPTIRNGKVWCIRVFFHFVLNYQDGSDYCWNYFHSTLSGPADENEYNVLLGEVTQET